MPATEGQKNKKIFGYKHSDEEAIAPLNYPYSRDFSLRLKSDCGCFKHKGSTVLAGQGPISSATKK